MQSKLLTIAGVGLLSVLIILPVMAKAVDGDRQAQRDERRAEMLERFDADGNGQLSQEERQSFRKEHIAKKLDSMSPEERDNFQARLEKKKERLRKRREWFKNLPEDERRELRKRWEQTSTDERRELRKSMKDIPSDRREEMRKRMREMSPEERKQFRQQWRDMSPNDRESYMRDRRYQNQPSRQRNGNQQHRDTR